MKNRKAFTIIELLAVIVIIGILATIVTIVITKYVTKGHEKYYNSLSNQIELAAKDYFSENKNELPKGEVDIETGYKTVAKKLKISTLETGNYLNNSPIDVNNNSCNESYVVVEYDTTKQTYNYHVCLICDDKNINNNEYCNIDYYYELSCSANVSDYAKGQKKITVIKNNVNSTITPTAQKGIISSEKVDDFTSFYIVNLNGDYTFNTSLSDKTNSCSTKVTGCDSEPPVIVASVTGGKNIATIKATITDNIGVTGYAITKDTTIPTVWTNITSILSVTTTFTETSVGTYYIHATDESGNTSYKEIIIKLSDLDSEAPVIVVSVTGGKNTASIKATMTDNIGVTGYAITSSTVVPDNWTNITSASPVTATFTKTSIGTYYVHATDANGNTNYKLVTLSASSNSSCPCSSYYPEYECGCSTCGGGCNSWTNQCTGGYYTDCRESCTCGWVTTCLSYNDKINNNNYNYILLGATCSQTSRDWVCTNCKQVCSTWVPKTCDSVCSSYAPEYECGCSTCGGGCKTYSSCWLG